MLIKSWKFSVIAALATVGAFSTAIPVFAQQSPATQTSQHNSLNSERDPSGLGKANRTIDDAQITLTDLPRSLSNYSVIQKNQQSIFENSTSLDGNERLTISESVHLRPFIPTDISRNDESAF